MAESPDKSAPATDDAPSPFRKFPWVQLVFCVACLAMTAWTWMRFSYAWNVTSYEFASAVDRGQLGSWLGRYVRLEEMIDTQHPIFILDTRTVSIGFGNGRFHAHAIVRVPYDPRTKRVALKPVGVMEEPVPSVRNSAPERNTVLHCLYGRAGWDSDEPGMIAVDSRASRFHPASIAGIVVGAMGVFIFGLYLRRWVKERRTAFATEHTPACACSRTHADREVAENGKP